MDYRKKIEALGFNINQTINVCPVRGITVRGWYLDDAALDYLDRRSEPYSTLAEAYEAAEMHGPCAGAKPRRMTLVEHSANRVTLGYDGEGYDGERIRIERHFSAPRGGGYVREQVANGDDPQVCDRLHHRGSTLTCGRGGLATVIRREYRRRKAAERREAEAQRGF